jgi:hypothetical protein
LELTVVGLGSRRLGRDVQSPARTRRDAAAGAGGQAPAELELGISSGSRFATARQRPPNSNRGAEVPGTWGSPPGEAGHGAVNSVRRISTGVFCVANSMCPIMYLMLTYGPGPPECGRDPGRNVSLSPYLFPASLARSLCENGPRGSRQYPSSRGRVVGAALVGATMTPKAQAPSVGWQPAPTDIRRFRLPSASTD